MTRKDKYGRGSAAANGEGFVDLAPGDTFAALEAQLKQRVADRFDNPVLGISASIGSKRNAEATITIKPADVGLRLYAIEALDIMRGERPEVHLAAEPRQFKTSRLLLSDRIAYYVGDVNRTYPKFISLTEPFTVERTIELLGAMLKKYGFIRCSP